MNLRYTFRDFDRTEPWRDFDLSRSGHPSGWEKIKGFRTSRWWFRIRRFEVQR